MPTKKTGALDAMRLAAAAGKQKSAKPRVAFMPAATSIAQSAEPEYMTTAMHIRVDQWERLRAVANRRVEGTRRRPSVSALLVEMLDRHLGEMEQEAGIDR